MSLAYQALAAARIAAKDAREAKLEAGQAERSAAFAAKLADRAAGLAAAEALAGRAAEATGAAGAAGEAPATGAAEAEAERWWPPTPPSHSLPRLGPGPFAIYDGQKNWWFDGPVFPRAKRPRTEVDENNENATHDPAVKVD